MPAASPAASAQRRKARVVALRATIPPESPFLAPEMEEVEVPRLAEPISPGQPRVTPPAIALSSILRRGGDQVMAVINGRLVGLNSEVAPGWIVRDIDPEMRRVRVEHTSGAAYLYTFRRDTSAGGDDAGAGSRDAGVQIDEVSESAGPPAAS